MCQVLRGESGLGDHSIDFFGEPVEGGTQGSSNGSECWQRGGEAWSQKAIVGSGKEERNAPAEIGDAISEAVGRALHQAVEAKPAQLVGHCAGGDRCGIAAGQGRKMLAQIGGPEALRGLSGQDEGLEKRLNAWVGKTQAGRALAAGCHRSVDGLQSIFAEDAIVAQPLDLDQPLVGRKSDRAQLCKILQAFADSGVVSVVDGRLGPQGSVFLAVLLGVTSCVTTRVRKRALAWRGILRLKMSSICSGRPRSRFSRITCSKKRRPCTGRSRTWGVENSD